METQTKEVDLVEEDLDEIFYEDPDTYGDIIYAAYSAYSMADMIDEKIVSHEIAEMVKGIKDKSLKLVDYAISAIYANNIEEELI